MTPGLTGIWVYPGPGPGHTRDFGVSVFRACPGSKCWKPSGGGSGSIPCGWVLAERETWSVAGLAIARHVPHDGFDAAGGRLLFPWPGPQVSASDWHYLPEGVAVIVSYFVLALVSKTTYVGSVTFKPYLYRVYVGIVSDVFVIDQGSQC